MVKMMRYTPILKWKKAEARALRDLESNQKNAIQPLLEFIRKTKQVEENGKKVTVSVSDNELLNELSSSIPQEILLSWGDGRPFFADFTLITPTKVRALFSAALIRKSSRLSLMPIPVININADLTEYIKYIISLTNEYLGSEICVRFSKADIENSNLLETVLGDFIKEYKLMPSDISILIDLKEDTSSESYRKALKALSKIVLLDDYKNVIVASGAFPEDMSEVTDENNRLKRADWFNWSQNKTGEHGLSRYPAFADYTIRHPIYNEQAMHHRATATIKYTLHNEWWFFKGKRSKYDMCLANASVLRKQSEFFGRDFSSGDTYIDDKGLYFSDYMIELQNKPNKKIGGTGNATTWICAGINHHVAVVVDQIANLDV